MNFRKHLKKLAKQKTTQEANFNANDKPQTPQLNVKLLKIVGGTIGAITVFALVYGLFFSNPEKSEDVEEQERRIRGADIRSELEISNSDRVKIERSDSNNNEIDSDEQTFFNDNNDILSSNSNVSRGNITPAYLSEETPIIVNNNNSQETVVNSQGDSQSQVIDPNSVSLFPSSSPRGGKNNGGNAENQMMIERLEETERLNSGRKTTDQENSDYLNSISSDYDYMLPMKVNNPISPYQIMQGTIIPILLETGINSELPGLITARVLSDVYNSVGGKYLIIPSGSRVIGNYSSSVAWGQKRLMVGWERLIRPDGTSINLQGMHGVDFAGYAGYTDKVDMKYKEISTLLFLSTLMNIGSGQISYLTEKFSDDKENNSAVGSVTQAASDSAEDVTEVINSMAEKFLNVSPSIMIRAGKRLNIMVNKDFIISPYQHGGFY